jgi:hypothetical protein
LLQSPIRRRFRMHKGLVDLIEPCRHDLSNLEARRPSRVERTLDRRGCGPDKGASRRLDVSTTRAGPP